jgi:DNA polymerase-1
LAGEKFNIKSVKDSNRILFDKLDITPVGKKGKSGNYSTDKKNLKKLSSAHPIVQYINDYKGLASIRSNFFEKLPKMVDPTTNRVHTKYNQAIAATGRLSSSEPNLQNVPKKSEGLGSLVRSAFIPRDDNHVIVSADYSQIELRVMAHLSGDPSLTDAFLKGYDVHSATAAKIYGVAVEDISKNDPRRKIAKSVNFGLNYGMTEYGLSESLTAETGRLVSQGEARQTIETYFENFTGVKSYMGKAIFDATTKGYAETLFGRRRALPDLDSSDMFKRESAKRIAVNVPIQGTAADLIKIAMNNLYREFLNSGMATKMIMQIHDELVFDVPKTELETATAIIKKVMESAAKLTVPLIVDIGSGDNWLEAH